jgi:hypothetical protein
MSSKERSARSSDAAARPLTATAITRKLNATTGAPTKVDDTV